MKVSMKHVFTVYDLMKMKFKPRNSGMWELDKEALVLTLHYLGAPHYEVALRRCSTSAEILDWIAQVSAKSWATPEIIGELVLTLNDFLKLQANFCSCGTEVGHKSASKIKAIIHERARRFHAA